MFLTDGPGYCGCMCWALFRCVTGRRSDAAVALIRTSGQRLLSLTSSGHGVYRVWLLGEFMF